MARSNKLASRFFSALQASLFAAVFLAIISFDVFGPSGLLAWTKNSSELEQRKLVLAEKREQYEALKNRVELLDRNNADPDLVSELLKRKLNVVHPDEKIIPLD